MSTPASEDRAEKAERIRDRQTPSALYVPAEGAMLWTVAFGPRDGPALVAVGGWIGSWELWAGTFGELSERWRVVSFDHRGTGATVSSPASISHERLVDDIFVVLDAYGIDRCVLAGESAGAGVVISAAARHPERVAGLVLVDGFIPTEPRRDDDPFPLSLRSDFVGTIDRFVDACLPDPDADALRHWGRLMLKRSTPEHAVACTVPPSTLGTTSSTFAPRRWSFTVMGTGSHLSKAVGLSPPACQARRCGSSRVPSTSRR